MKGKNDSTPFLPLNVNTGGKVTYIQNKEAMCLTERQADHVYKAVEEGNMINNKTVTCESMTCKTNQCQDNNPYKRVVLNNVYKEQDKSPEMKSWSIFSDNVRYVQHDQMMMTRDAKIGCGARLYMHCPNPLQIPKEFWWKMDNMSVHCLLSQ